MEYDGILKRQLPTRGEISNSTDPEEQGQSDAALPSCIVQPELTEGPYFVDGKLDRSDIRADTKTREARHGTPLSLIIDVLSVTDVSCSPLKGAMVDVWQCDALGVYSGIEDNVEDFNTLGEDWLRGYQETDPNGRVQFATIYPGWYRGRSTHIHFKVRKDNLEFTSQWFFDDALSDEVHTRQAPYNEKGAFGRLPNSQDSIFQESNGVLLLDVRPSEDGFIAGFTIGIRT